MFDPITDRKVQLCQVAAQMAADGDVSPCAAARLAVAQELKEKAARLRYSAHQAERAVYTRRDLAHADELEKTAQRLEFEARECTPTE